MLNTKVEYEEHTYYYENELANLTEKISKALDELENANASSSTNTPEEKPVEPKEDPSEAEEEMTYDSYTNDRFGFTIEYPSNLTARFSTRKWGWIELL